MASRDLPLVQSKDTAVSVTLSHVTPLKTDVPDMTVGLRKNSTPNGSPLASATSTLDSRFGLPVCPQFSTKEFQPVETFVSNAISSPNTRQYRAILDALRKREDPLLLCKVLLAFRGTTLNQLVVQNHKAHARLLHLLFRLDPFFNEPCDKLPDPLYSLADAHLHLILALVSANSVFLTPAMNALWRLVTTPTVENDVPQKEARTRRLHATLANMVRLVPKGNSELFPVLAANFPFRTKPSNELQWYTRQCLTVLGYVPTLHSQVLELLLDKCLEMDVEIKIDDGGKVSIDASSHSLEDAEEEMFELEIDNENDTSKPMQQEQVEEQVDEMADKVRNLGVWKLVCVF